MRSQRLLSAWWRRCKIRRVSIILLAAAALSGACASIAPYASAQEDTATDLNWSIWKQFRSAAKPSYTTLAPGTEGSQLAKTIVTVINSFFGVLGVVTVLLLIYAGFLWTTAGGNDDQISKAKTIIKQTAVGMLVVLLAYGIVSFAIVLIVPNK